MTWDADEIAAARRRAGQYLVQKQCPQGGFCFYRTGDVNEPNLADTYHAVTALERLGSAVARPGRVIDYLRSVAPSGQPWDLFHLTGAWRALDAHYAPDAETRRRIEELRIGPVPERGSIALTGWLERTRLILCLQRDFGDTIERDDSARIVTDFLHAGGFGAGPNLWDTWQAIDVLRLCGVAPAQLPGVVEFVDRLQVAALGFQATADSCSGRLDLIWAGIHCCRALGLPIRHANDALRFVLACQVQSGGFARAPDALPDIVLTRRAVDVLFELRFDLASRMKLGRDVRAACG